MGEEAAELGRATSHPATPAALAMAGLAAWKRGDLDELARLSDEALAVTEELHLPVGLHAANLAGVRGLVSGQLDEAERWFAIALEAPDADDAPVQWLVTATDRVLAAAYAKSPHSPRLTDAARRTDPRSPDPAWRLRMAWSGRGGDRRRPGRGAPPRSVRSTKPSRRARGSSRAWRGPSRRRSMPVEAMSETR